MPPVRRGGHARTPLGELVTWSQAEGERGTRWREAIERGGVLVRSVLLEVSTADRPTRLELTTRAGLLTLHPEPDQTAMHGNVVAADGVRHLAFPWSAEHELLVLSSPASATIAVRRLDRRVIVGAVTVVDMLRIDDDLEPRPVRWSVERMAQHGWHLRDTESDEERRLTVEDDGRPALHDEVSWPLEA
ncbi:MAG TPA: hypothetical protein VK867_13565 [Candidatus Limnocylindrales bacterium]|nr:hypothetical protein [Candidatus Limnocylindrales bacterium]